MAVTASTATNVFGLMAWLSFRASTSCAAAAHAGAAPEGHDQRRECHEHGDGADVRQHDAVLQPVDVLAERMLDVAQLAPDGEHLAAELADRVLLFGRQQRL